jgi:hypothetical protein
VIPPRLSLFLCARYPANRTQLFGRRGMLVWVSHSCGSDLFIGHGPEPVPICFVFKRLRGAIRQYLNDGSVTVTFGYDNILFAHASLLFSPR